MGGICPYEELRTALFSLQSGETLTLKPNTNYHVYEENCISLYGYHAGNTATREENPNGKRLAAIYLKDKKNVTVDGKGATLIIHGRMTPLVLDNCEGVILKNFTVDYARHTMNEYTVEESRQGESIIRMSKGCLYEVTDGRLYFLGERDRNGTPYWRTGIKGSNLLSMYCDPKTEQVKFLPREKGDRFPSVPTAKRAEDLGNGRVRMLWQDPEAALLQGCIIQTRDVRRLELGALLQYCKNIRLENITVRFMNGFGLLCQFCENVTYSHLDCTPSDGHTIACNADFFHFLGCRGHIRIERCKAAGAHDDFVNVHGAHLRIIDRDEQKKSLLVRFENPNTWGLRAFSAGDRIDLIRSETLLPYATRRVKAVERINDTDLRLLFNSLPDTIALGKDVVENATWTPRLTVTGNRFGPSMGRGILCTTRKRVRIKNNEFYKLGGSVLVVADDCNFWMESGYTTDILFQNNTLTECGYGAGRKPVPLISVHPEISSNAKSAAVHKRLRLIRNRIIGEPYTFDGNEYVSIKRVIEKKTVTERKEIVT